MRSTEPLRKLVESRIPEAHEREIAHWRVGVRWHKAEVLLRWSTAVVAAVSGVAMIGKSDLLTGIFSLLTVVLAASNAALGPADRAASNKAASTAFATIYRKLHLALNTDLAVDSVSDDRFTELRQLVELCDEAIAQQLKDAPLVRVPTRAYESPEAVLVRGS